MRSGPELGPGVDGAFGGAAAAACCCALNRCQHAAHRHSTDEFPAASTALRIRHPWDDVSVLSPFVSGERRMHPMHF